VIERGRFTAKHAESAKKPTGGVGAPHRLNSGGVVMMRKD
jgi:hypothetical protein